MSGSFGPGTNYVYAEDGTCPDGIDVYKVTGKKLTHLQNVQVGCSETVYYGAHHVDVVRAPQDCLIYSSSGENTVYSFKIHPKTGELSAKPAGSVAVDDPQDITSAGSTAFVSSPSASIDVLRVGSGCALTLTSENSTNDEQDVNIGLAGPTTVVSADIFSGDMVAYKLHKNGKLAEIASDPGQLPAPDGIAVANGGRDVYTGSASGFNPAEAQGFSYVDNAFTPLPGSPQTSSDQSSKFGIAMVAATKYHLLAEGDISGQISWYKLGRKMSYTGDTALADPTGQPTDFALRGDNLLVAQTYGGDLEDCTLATDNVSDCHTVATLTGAGSGNGGSVAILTEKK